MQEGFFPTISSRFMRNLVPNMAAITLFVSPFPLDPNIFFRTLDDSVRNSRAAYPFLSWCETVNCLSGWIIAYPWITDCNLIKSFFTPRINSSLLTGKRLNRSVKRTEVPNWCARSDCLMSWATDMSERGLNVYPCYHIEVRCHSSDPLFEWWSWRLQRCTGNSVPLLCQW